MLKNKRISSAMLVLIVLSSIVFPCKSTVTAATNQFRGVNWADSRDNFQSGVIYISGLTSSDTYSSASIVADRIISQFMVKLGSNSVRMPINEATVSTYWGTYTGAIDNALSKGKVLLCYWSAAHGAKPADTTAFWTMWRTVVNKYGSDSNCYFEIYNEPNAYSKADLLTLYNNWLTKYTGVPRNRVILDGTGMAQNVPDVGADSRFSGCLFAVHDYSMWGSTTWTSDSLWGNHVMSYVGTYADRTVCTEWGGPMSPGSKNGVSYGSMNYDSIPRSNYFEAYINGMSSQLHKWNMGSFYWVGLKDGDWYSMTTKSGSGSTITLTVPNQTGLGRLQYAWGYSPTSVLPSVKMTTQSLDIKASCKGSMLTIKSTQPQSGLTSIEILNLNGKVMKIMRVRSVAGKNYSRSFDLGNIPEGCYLVKLENGIKTINSSKILVTR
jgi:hypothetical protein